MHLMHDWWSAFIAIANRAGSRISRRGKTVRLHSLGPHWKSLSTGKYIFFGQGYETSSHMASDTDSVTSTETVGSLQGDLRTANGD